VARALGGLASCFAAAGREDQALDHWREALAVYTSIGSAEADRVRARLADLADTDRGQLRAPAGVHSG
jgi:hypothetical protein